MNPNPNSGRDADFSAPVDGLTDTTPLGTDALAARIARVFEALS